MKVTRTFMPDIDRYHFDAETCSYERGWAQVDTRQDASYYGTWASPAARAILNYAEGDVVRTVCDTDEEFAQALRGLAERADEHGWGPLKIDPGFDPAMKAAFERIGLADMLH